MIRSTLVLTSLLSLASIGVDGFQLCGLPQKQLFPFSNRRLRNPLYSQNNLDFELREARILVDKFWRTGNSLGLAPDEVANTRRLQGYLNDIVDGGSPIALDQLGSSDFFSGRWRLAYSTDPRATILGNPMIGDTRLFLDVSPRVGTAFGTLVQRIEVNGKPGLRGQAKYTVTDAGVVQLQYEKITATVMGLEVDTPPFLAKQASSSIQTKWFNGQMWIERLKVQDVDGVPEEARAAIEAASLAAGTPGYIYNVYRFDGD